MHTCVCICVCENMCRCVCLCEHVGWPWMVGCWRWLDYLEVCNGDGIQGEEDPTVVVIANLGFETSFYG